MKDYGKYFNTPSVKEARKRVKRDVRIDAFDPVKAIKPLGYHKKYHIKTFGCQANEADTESIKGILEALAFVETADEQFADLIILNTCAIRENAENRVFGELGRLKKYKRNHPDLLLAMAGCMPQEESVIERVLTHYPYLDLVFGTHNIHKLPEYLETAIFGKERVIEIHNASEVISENLPKRREYTHKAWVNIMYGCDAFCTYCVVPHTRGAQRSRHLQNIIQEVDELIQNDYREITLLGQNVNAYGKDLDHQIGFAGLLEALSKTGIERIRFTTSHPRDLDEETIRVIAQHANIMPHIHLPVQSGSNAILKAMNRQYTKAQYMNIIHKIYQHIPKASITTDIIVGFPGESTEDFQETLNLIEEARFEGAFTFIFSARANTPASHYEDATSRSEKEKRLAALNQKVNVGYLKGHQRFIDETVLVLVDGPSKKGNNVLAGYSEHNKLVNFAGPTKLIGKIVPIKITEAKTWFLKGEYHEKS